VSSFSKAAKKDQGEKAGSTSGLSVAPLTGVYIIKIGKVISGGVSHENKKGTKNP
jgi:hypothetical protein